MGHSSSKVSEVLMPQEDEMHPAPLLANLNAVVKALYQIEQLKIELEWELATQTMLQTTCFDSMRELQMRRDEEIECIKSETEKQIIKYKRKAKSFT